MRDTNAVTDAVNVKRKGTRHRPFGDKFTFQMPTFKLGDYRYRRQPIALKDL